MAKPMKKRNPWSKSSRVIHWGEMEEETDLCPTWKEELWGSLGQVSHLLFPSIPISALHWLCMVLWFGWVSSKVLDVEGLVSSPWSYGEVEKPLRDRAYGPARGVWSFPFPSLCFLVTRWKAFSIICSQCAVLPWHRSKGHVSANRGLKSATLNPNKLFLLSWLSRVFYYSNRKLIKTCEHHFPPPQNELPVTRISNIPLDIHIYDATTSKVP